MKQDSYSPSETALAQAVYDALDQQLYDGANHISSANTTYGLRGIGIDGAFNLYAVGDVIRLELERLGWTAPKRGE